MGNSNRKKMVEKLKVKAKEMPKDPFLEQYADEIGSKYSYSYHEDLVSVLNQQSLYGGKYGFYAFQDLTVRQSAMRAQNEMFANDPESALSKQPDPDLEKILYMVAPSKESQFVSTSLEVIKFLAEIPLTDMKFPMKNIRKHRLCRSLYLLI